MICGHGCVRSMIYLGVSLGGFCGLGGDSFVGFGGLFVGLGGDSFTGFGGDSFAGLFVGLFVGL